MERLSTNISIPSRGQALQLEAVRLSPAQAEFALLSVRRLVEDLAFMRRFSQRDRLEFDQLEGVLAEVVEG